MQSFFITQHQRLKSSFTVAHYPLRNSAILDTGTTIHIFNEVSRFLRITAAPEGDHVWAGDSKVSILGYGDVDIMVKGPQGPQILRLYGAAYCENFACNLVSFKQLQNRGIWWDTRPGQNCLRWQTFEMLAKIEIKYDQYVLEYIDKDVTKRSFFARRNRFNSFTQKRPQRAPAMLWHLRLGHPGPQVIEHLTSRSLGVRIKGPTTAQCEDCGVSKIKRQIRRTRRYERKDPIQPFERLAIDFHDIEEDPQGFNSLVLVTERTSGYMWDFYLTDRKSKTLIDLLTYIIDFFESRYKKPSVIECDNEIVTQKPKVAEQLAKLQVKVEPSAPYAQAQNGGAERSGGVIKDKARAMSGKLPNQLWREVYSAAVYLYNRSPRYSNNWMTPYEALLRRKPGQEHLKAYGCKVFVMKPDALRKEGRLKRLNPKAWIGYLVGYTSSNIYRIWVPVRNTIISARDVIFDEEQIFDGTIEGLALDVKEVDLEDLARTLQQITMPVSNDITEEAMETGPSLEDAATFDLTDDLWTSSSVEEHLGTDLQTDTFTKREEAVQSEIVMLPSPPQTPPAALLAAAIASGREEPSYLEDPYVLDPKKHVSWQGAFAAGRLGNAIGTINGQPVDRARLLRLLRSPKPRIHRRDLPPPPDAHSDLETHPLGKMFAEAEQDHLRSHREMSSWSEVARSSIKKRIQVLDCMWVYVYKFDKHGRFLKCKSRLVVRGDQQARSPHNTYAATLAGRSFRTLIALAARFDLELVQYDAVNAFVNAKLDEEIYMKMPPGHRRQGTILRLHKALYGLRKSPLLWQRELTGALKSLGFKPVPSEPCCLTRNGILIFFYVDDIVFAFSKQMATVAQSLIERLKARYALSGGGDLQWFLGIEIIRDRQKRLIWLSQASFIDKISSLATSQPRSDTPMGIEELLPYAGKAKGQESRLYQVKIGSLLYAAVITRPDIAFAVSRLARFNCNPSPRHHYAADRVLCYLRRTRALALKFGGGDDFEVASDASFADNTLDRKSSQAYAMKLFGGLIGWRANKQETVSTSTTEAELLALAQAAKEAEFMSRLFEELTLKLESKRIRVQCDNKQTIRLVNAEIATLRTQLRHVDIHNHWLRQEVAQERIEVTYTPSAKLMADGLTKALQGTKFQDFVKQIGLEPVAEQLEEKRQKEEKDEEELEELVMRACDKADPEKDPDLDE